MRAIVKSRKGCIFGTYTKKIRNKMFEFQQYLGFIVAMTVITMAFWLLIFLIGFACYWATGGTIEFLKEKKAKKQQLEESQM